MRVWQMLMSVLLLVGGGRAGWAAEEASTAHVFRYEAKGHRDPFVPLVRDGRFVTVNPLQGDASTLTLTGILWDPTGESVALINDAEAKVGDVLGEYHIVEIRQDAVVLEHQGGETMVLQLTFETPPLQRSLGATTGGR